MKFWGIEIDLEVGEEVIIDSAEQRGVVNGINIDSIEGHLVYSVVFKRGTVHTIDKGYDSRSAWFFREDLRKIKKKEPKFFVCDPRIRDFFEKLDAIGK